MHFTGGDSNLYRYVRNNPVNLIDPSGLFGIEDIYVPDWLSDGAAGFGSALSFGITDLINEELGASVDKCSMAYQSAYWGAMAMAMGRLTYAGIAKGGSLFAGGAREAVDFRNSLKVGFRLGLSKEGVHSYESMLAKYGGCLSDVIKAAGRTNGGINAYAAGILGASGSGEQCECQ